MRAIPLIIAAGVVALAAWRKEEVADAGGSIANEVADVFYAITQETKNNEAKYAPTIANAEQLYGIPKGLLHRQLYQESRFRTDIITGKTVSSAGALGIAQIIPRWHPDVDPLDPIASINYAARFMRSLYQRFGSWRQALAAYNWGQGNQSKDLRDGIVGNEWPKETRDYVAQITSDVEVA